MTTTRANERPGAPRHDGIPSRPRADGVVRRLVATDALAVLAAVALSGRDGLSIAPESVVPAIVSAASWMSALSLLRTRRASVIGAGGREFARVVVAAFAAVGAASLILSVASHFVVSTLAVQFLVAVTLLLIGRGAWRLWLVRRRDRGDHLADVLVVGDGALGVARRIASAPEAGLNVIDVQETPLTSCEVVEAACATGARGVVIASAAGMSAEQLHELRWDLESRGVALIFDTAVIGVGPRRLELWNVDDLALLRVAPRMAHGPARRMKSLLDRGCALVGLGVLLPLFALVAAVIKAEDGGTVFFRQKRVGENGAEFDIVKFRTMAADAEDRIGDLTDRNEADGPLFKMKEDPRVTRVGRLLRKYSIDELPQLWNVLRGEMSLVGPRPALPSEVAEYGTGSRRRLSARPGITGLWQVSGRSDLDWERGLRLDLAYIDNWSLLYDGLILARTAREVVRPRGAY
ncbi:sugar transferase [Microbacterium sp. NPDC057407]|uniref:sugar transferase n=1 Tax=Microbacterium sp. NPDC057407 TaxID=3346120 RepID=UPI00366B2754